MSLGPKPRYQMTMTEQLAHANQLGQLQGIIHSLQRTKDVQARERQWLLWFIAPLAKDLKDMFESRFPEHYPTLDWMLKKADSKPAELEPILKSFRALNEGLQGSTPLEPQQVEYALELATDLRRWVLDFEWRCHCH